MAPRRATDATERTIAELRSSEQRLSALIRASSDVVYTMSPDWRELRNLIGQDFVADTSEPTREWMERYVHPADRVPVQREIDKAIRTRSDFQLEHRVIRIDGSTGWTFSRAVPVLDEHGEVLQWMGMASDITARKQAELALAQSTRQAGKQRRLYEAILTNTPDLAYVFDLQHRFIYANEGLLTMWGKSAEEALGQNCLQLGYEPWHAAMHDREIDQVAATGKPVRGEVPFTGTSGRRIYDYIMVPVFGPDGAVEAVAGTNRDVTHLRDADRRKDEFLAMLAHELRNPLAPLRTSLEILRLRGAAAADSVRDVMQRQVEHLVRLVDDLLEMSRITTGALDLRREPVEINALVQSAMETSETLVHAGRHQLDVSLPREPLWVCGDAVRLSQVLGNLLNNAARYTPAGGNIFLSVRREGNMVHVTVRDNGVGIEQADMTRIFELFGRVQSGLQGEGGLGIGLTLAQRLAQMHGGVIVARSEGEGRGSEFVLQLPLLAQAPAISKASAPAIEPEARPVRVLVVDDNIDAAETLAMLLEMRGAQVKTVHSGPAALTAFDAMDPEVVLLDIGMPGMDGYEVARQLRQRPGGRQALLVALTGWGQEQDRRRTREAGFSHHLVKPADIDQLQQLIFEGAPPR